MAVIDVVVVTFEDLDGRILGVNLAFDKGLEDFGDPDVKANLAAGRDNFKRKVFLDAT